jgi:hypothetical protein
MDIVNLAQQTISVLGPALPYLIDAGHGAAKTIGEKTAEAVSDSVGQLWAWLQAKAHISQPGLLDAARELATNPESESARAELTEQTRLLLQARPELLQELEGKLSSVTVQHNAVNAAGPGAVAIGGSVTGSTITTNVNR